MSKSFSEEEATDYTLKMIKTTEVKLHVKQSKILDDKKIKLYSLLWENSTYNIKAKIKYSTKYQNKENDQNGITLLNDL